MSGFDYSVHTDLNLIEVRPSGVVHLADILSYAQEVLSLGVVTEGTIECYDLSEMTNLSLDYQSARALTEALREWLSRGWQGSVFFTPQDHQFGMIRMIGAVVESIEGAPGGMMIPRREPTPLGEVRNLIAEHRQISSF
jgi:hypothetical protein